MPTQPDQWETVKSLFEAALELDSAQRPKLLAERCQNASVRAEVERLLAEYDEAGAFLSMPAMGSSLSPEPDAPIQRLVEGDLLAQRFRILRFLAAGGMGQVYEAEDLELREHVAIKTIRPDILAQTNALARFKREVYLARKVTHPNVCRIYDLFRNKSTDVSQPDTVFVSMELLCGQTLSERLKTGMRMDTAEALPLVLQMASALAAAHSVGIVHRDFKPGNVVLVVSSGQRRAVVTDFGLALQPLDSGDGISISSGLGIRGTPAYMAPEQLEGRPATNASDIYALGLVLYEMTTGGRPFLGDTPMSAAMKRLVEMPTPPRKLEPSLDRNWEATILRCLERNPENRFTSAMDVVKSLTEKTPSQRKRRLKLVVFTSIILLILFMSGIGYYFRMNRSSVAPKVSSSQSGLIKHRPSVAVLGFKNLSGRPDTEWLSVALSEMLSADLAAGEQLRTVPGENVARAKIDLSLPDADSFAKDTLDRIRKNMNTDYVVLGSYFDEGTASGGELRVDLRLQDAKEGETIASVSEAGNEARLLDVVSRTGTTLREKLGVGALSSSEIGSVRAALPSNRLAARLYAEGIKKLRLFDAVGARDLLEKAITAEPTYPMSHSALAAAWLKLGHDEKAKEEARKAFDLSSNLSREDRLSVEARYRETIHQWDKAVELYRALYSFFPDNLDYGLQMASAQRRAGKRNDALLTLDGLRRLPVPAKDDPRIDLVEAQIAEHLGDFKREQAAAAKAIEKAEEIKAPLLVAEAQLGQCWAFHMGGQENEARVACENAGEAYARSRDRGGAAAALSLTATILWQQGDLSGAQSKYEEALAVFRQIGDQSQIALVLNNSANVQADRGDHIGAKRRYEQALQMYREMGRKDGIGLALSNVAAELMLMGDLRGANSKFRQALAVNREIGSEDYQAGDLTGLGETLYFQGGLGDSEKMFNQSLAISRRINFKQNWGETLCGLGNLLRARGVLADARSQYEAALAIYREIGAEIDTVKTRLLIAEISIEEGHADAAESAAREARDVFQKHGNIEDELRAAGVLARSLVMQDKFAEAEKEIETATTSAKKVQNEEVLLKFAFATALVRSATLKPADLAVATRTLKAAFATAAQHGYVPYQLEALLALGEIEIESGHGEDGRARLAALEREAMGKGFSFIAKKAEIGRAHV